MADFKVQLKDKDGNRQFPVTTTNLVVNADGKTVEQRLQALEAEVNSGGNTGGTNATILQRIEALENILIWEKYNK